MFQHLPLFVLLLIFGVAAAATWLAGIHLSNTTDILSTRWGLGQALGGLVVLAVVTNLPELAIVASGALHQQMDLAVGNVLGGIAAQTVVLVILDVAGLGKEDGLTYTAATLSLVLEGVLVLAILAVSVMGTQLPDTLIFLRLTPTTVLITVLWVGGLKLISQSRTSLPWQDKGAAPHSQTKPRGHAKPKKEKHARSHGHSTGRTLAVFLGAALVTLVCGVALEQSGDALAKQWHMDGVLFGGTVLAFATSLPEISTGLASIKEGDYQLAISDIFGGNAFLPVLFLLATLLSGKTVLPHAQKSDIYLTGLGMLLTTVYVTGLIFRPRRQIARMGIDSLIVLVLYLMGIGGLFAIARGS